ncbi:MAG: FGGY-family carbohydrate kinase, partial [Pseudomonadota bacterium]
LALGIDVGTSGVRAALLGAEGVAGFAKAAMADHGGDLRDPAVWARALDAALAGLDPGLKAEVGALAVDATSGTVLALDEDEAPIGQALLYNDAVDDPAIPATIAAVAPRESAAHGAASGLARAIALAARPGARRILHQADWIVSLMTGERGTTDESNALKTGYDPVARRWPEWLDALPIDRAMLPRVVAAGAPMARVSAAAAARHGLPEGAVAVGGMTDGCASFMATGAGAPGDGVTALGTTLTVKLLSDRPVFAPEYGIYSHRIGDLWLAGGASNTGGGALAAHFAPEAIARLSATIDPAHPTGLDYYPLPRPGERFPIADPDLAPRTEPRPADDATFLQGLLEGIAGIEALAYRRLGELGAPPLARLRTVGGGAQNAAWTAIRARATGATMAGAASEEAAVGVARLARAHLDRAHFDRAGT